MNQNTTKHKGQVEHALKVVRQEIASLGQKIRVTPAGAERDDLEKQMKELMDSIGMEYVSNPDLPQASTAGGTGTESGASVEVADTTGLLGVGKAMLKAMSEAPHVAGSGKTIEELADQANAKIDEAIKGLSRWQRIKLCYAGNKKKFWAGFALTLGVIAGTVYWLTRAKNAEAVSSVMAMADTGAPEVTPETGGETTSASIFTRIGDWIVTAAKATKDFVVKGVSKFVGWVKSFFNKTNQETTNGQPETAAPGEVVPA